MSMKRYRITAIMTDECVCVGHSAADALALVLDHAGARWFLHWKQKPGAITRTWHLVMANPPTLLLDAYVPYVVDAEDANEAMVALGKMLIEDRPPGPLDWLGGQYSCHQTGLIGYAIPMEVPKPTVVPDTAGCLFGQQLKETEGPAGDQPIRPEDVGLDMGMRDVSVVVVDPLSPLWMKQQRAFGGFADVTLSSLGGAGGQPINETDTGFVQARSTGHSVEDGDDGFEEPLLDEIDPDCFRGPWTVTVVMADRSHGGREEGGWWFDTFDPFDQYARDRAIDHKIDRLFWKWADAVAYSLEVEEKCQEWNTEERRRRKDSVASIGVYEAYVYEGYPVRIPAEKPMYE